MIEDFRLRVFAQVAQLGSFTAAAKALGVSQPAVSQHIAELEKYAGGQLFERGRGSVRLTARGRTFLTHAEGILADYRNLDNEFHVPETTLLRGVRHEGRVVSILIRQGRFADLDAPADTPAELVVPAEGTAILPSFFNTHTHAAMTRQISIANASAATNHTAGREVRTRHVLQQVFAGNIRIFGHRMDCVCNFA